jgi:hypothetical protein
LGKNILGASWLRLLDAPPAEFGGVLLVGCWLHDKENQTQQRVHNNAAVRRDTLNHLTKDIQHSLPSKKSWSGRTAARPVNVRAHFRRSEVPLPGAVGRK